VQPCGKAAVPSSSPVWLIAALEPPEVYLLTPNASCVPPQMVDDKLTVSELMTTLQMAPPTPLLSSLTPATSSLPHRWWTTS